MSSSDSPPSKRRRTDSEDEPIPPAAPAIKRSEIWHEDGSVVLQAQDTQFRVHWGLLTMHSSVFKDMYGLPQPDVAGPTVEGCLVVPVFDDPMDLLHFFRVLYNPTMLVKESLPFAIVAALVRIGQKYDFKELLQEAVRRITDDYPSTLAGFDALPKTRRIGSFGAKHFDVLRLAREHNILSVLPLTYYLASCGRSPARWFGGVHRPDGTTSSLSPDDLEKCVKGASTLFRTQLKPGYTLGWLCAIPNTCTDLRGCAQHRTLDVLQRHARASAAEPGRDCPLIPLQDDPTELEALLKVLYDSMILTQKTLPFSIVAALVRVGRKYDFSALVKAGVERITTDYPSTLTQYDALKGAPKSIASYQGLELDILSLCLEMGIRSALPAIYYGILELPHEQWATGFERPDGTIAQLSRESLKRCIVGQASILRTQLEPGYPLAWLCTPREACEYESSCLEDRMATYRWLMGPRAPQGCKLLSRTTDNWFEGLCDSCSRLDQAMLHTGRKTAWTELPTFFDLPPWGELVNEIQ
uniref:BTB domain-containing protein n=1 Tax=Mycena chlorophos TaxID=658473 RepID=A0ABQ0LYL0_MYCCL|nr:predicted protein [Mycena chlorophos]